MIILIVLFTNSVHIYLIICFMLYSRSNKKNIIKVNLNGRVPDLDYYTLFN